MRIFETLFGHKIFSIFEVYIKRHLCSFVQSFFQIGLLSSLHGESIEITLPVLLRHKSFKIKMKGGIG